MPSLRSILVSETKEFMKIALEKSIRKFLPLIAIQFLTTLFWLLNWKKGIWVPEETSQFFPWRTLIGLGSDTYIFDGTAIDGRSINQLPLGIFFGLIDLFAPSHLMPLITTLCLSLLLNFSIVLFLSRFIKNQIVLHLASIATVFSFVSLNTSTYLSKTSASVFFLLVFWSLTSERFQSMKVFFVSFICLGMLANIATASTGFLSFAFAGLYLLTNGYSLSYVVKTILKSILTCLTLVVPTVYQFYFSDSQISNLLLRIQDTYYIFGSNKYFLIGSGYWAENSKFENIPYFPWSPEISDPYYEIRFYLTVLFIIVCVFNCQAIRNLHIGNLSFKNISQNLNLKVFWIFSSVMLSLAIFIAFPESINPLRKAIEQFGILSGFREPWAKFEFIFLVSLHALIAFVAQELHSLSVERKDEVQRYLKRSLHSKQMSNSKYKAMGKDLLFLKVNRFLLVTVGCCVCLVPAMSYTERAIMRHSDIFPPFVNNVQSSVKLINEIEKVRNSALLSEETLELCLYTDSEAGANVISQLLMMSLGAENRNSIWSASTRRGIKVIKCESPDARRTEFIGLKKR